MIPDLSNDADMIRKGRLSALHKARKETAEQARDMCSRMLNHVDDSSLWDIDRLAELFREIQAINLMIDDNSKGAS